MIEKLDYFT